jgi:hypothetical protein
MTGRLNRASGLFAQPLLLRLLDHEAAQSQRHETPLAVLRLSLHPDSPLDEAAWHAADQLAGQIFNTQLRAIDLPGHLEGGYLIVLPFTTEAGCRAVATRLVRAVAGLHLPYPAHHVGLALCAGAAAHPGGQQCDGSRLADQAGAALAEARRRGPHSVVTHGEIDPAA